ncbi:MAG TPA: PEP-CTERM sorting domain-containing protein [Rhodanobacteraceae bacterium]|nr:PEP-CTERM sorting domain-containing protein [Rhodanobacteraceae bacterium]
MNKFPDLRLSRFVPVGLIALAAVVLFAPAPARATTLTYDFTVTATSGPLNGSVSHGTFSFDSSSITPGTGNPSADLLTALDFAWNGTTYNAGTANTGFLVFNAAGQLTFFVFGNSCSPGECSVYYHTDEWFVAADRFVYSTPDSYVFNGDVTYSQAAPSVPEPAALGMFGLGLLLIGGYVGLRRRVA